MAIGPFPDPIIAAVVSALLTGGLSYFVSYRSDVRDEESRRRSLRESIIAEIEAMEIKSVNNITSTSGYDRFPTTVYESNAGKIGSLTNKEREAIVGFYARIMIKKSEFETARATAVHNDSMPESPLKRSTAKKLNERREAVLEIIRDELSG
jgi:hypothetical protein